MYLLSLKALMPLGFFLNNTIEVSFIMITSRISRQAIFRGVLGLILITGFHFDAIASKSDEDLEARKKLVDKYKDDRVIRSRLETILVTGLSEAKANNRQEINKFFNAPDEIAAEKGPKATEALVDLLDFDLGYMIGVTVLQLISVRGKEALPFLKKKISQKPYSSEKTADERNSDIVMLIKAISCGVKYVVGGKNYTVGELVKFNLFYIQMDLEKYYREKGCYPKDLSQAYCSGHDREITEKNMGQKLKYKGYEHIYFLCALGEDGKLGTPDDVKPPYNTDVFSFPENFKE
jgi:hypothetical protein